MSTNIDYKPRVNGKITDGWGKPKTANKHFETSVEYKDNANTIEDKISWSDSKRPKCVRYYCDNRRSTLREISEISGAAKGTIERLSYKYSSFNINNCLVTIKSKLAANNITVKGKYCYSVIYGDKVLLENEPSSIVSNYLGCSTQGIYYAVKNGSLIDNRYHITRQQISPARNLVGIKKHTKRNTEFTKRKFMLNGKDIKLAELRGILKIDISTINAMTEVYEEFSVDNYLVKVLIVNKILYSYKGELIGDYNKTREATGCKNPTSYAANKIKYKGGYIEVVK